MAALIVAAIAVGLDNFGASIGLGASYGRSSLRWQAAAIFGVFEGGMPIAGLLAGRAGAHTIAGVAPIIGGTVVGLLGACTVVSALGKGPSHPRREQHGLAMLVVLGLVLSLDNLAVGFALGSLRLSLLLVAVVIGVTSVLLTLLGLELGDKLGVRAGERGELVGGVALVAVGILIGLGIA